MEEELVTRVVVLHCGSVNITGFSLIGHIHCKTLLLRVGKAGPTSFDVGGKRANPPPFDYLKFDSSSTLYDGLMRL